MQINTSDQNRVILRNLNLRSAGQYRCEISAEAPLFNTVSRRSRMEIVGEGGRRSKRHYLQICTVYTCTVWFGLVHGGFD